MTTAALDHTENPRNPREKRRKRKKINKKQKNINLLYANPCGISGKISSLTTVAQSNESHIIALAETKLGNTPPVVAGYTWYNKPRKLGSGGVALLVRDDIKHMTKLVQEIEDYDQEILWIEINMCKEKVFIGVYYGPQEKCSNEEADRQYSQMSSQINKLKSKGEVVLMGDFNAKLEIKNKEVQQKASRNGEYLEKMLSNTNTTAKSIEATTGNWTRVKRKDQNERSVIDYVIMTEKIAQTTKYLEIDEIGAHRLKGKEESDHNTMIIETAIPKSDKIEKKTMYNTKDKKKWKKFNRELHTTYHRNPPENYDEFEEKIKDTMELSFDKITVKLGQYKPKMSDKIKKLKIEKKESRKQFEKATRENKKETMEKYIDAQKQLREELEKFEKENVQKRIHQIIKEGGVKSNLFWRVRKRVIRKSKPEEDYDTITEDDRTLIDPDETKEYIAEYYEDLYQAREGCDEYKEWTEKIKQSVHDIEQEMRGVPDEPDFSAEELIKTIKSLKPGKATGPDGIPNEMLREADALTMPIYQQEMNKILKSTEIPTQWTEGNLKRLFKGKGKKGKCSNERGITLASNVGKAFERLVNNRILEEVNITDAQAGGRKGMATVDHILIMKEIVNICKAKKEEAILTYLDVTKAYDKAWLDAIMYVLHKEGIKSKLWLLVKNLNTNLKTTILTKYGPTRKITIRDSIRQGGVLSVVLYALLMDEVSKELTEANLGIEIPNTNHRVPTLLWMDDVLLMEDKTTKSQTLLNITNDVSQRYHIEFGMPKTKYIRASKRRNPIELKIGERTIAETEKYTYLGEVNNRGMNLKDHIKHIGGKVEGAYQTLIAVAEDREFKGIKMQCIWKLVETCIIPIITYASETWEPNKAEMKKLNQMLDKIIRRILMTPDATPREALYIETGMLDIEAIIDIKRLNMMARLKRERTALMDIVLSNPECKWKKKTREVMEKHNIYEWELAGSEKEKRWIKHTITERVTNTFRERMNRRPEDRTKIIHFLDGRGEWTPEEPAKYMYKLTRKQASIIFKTRTRMIKVKGNYKNGYTDLMCRACEGMPETQKHVLSECRVLHPNGGPATEEINPFSQNVNILKETARKIENIIEEVNNGSTGRSQMSPVLTPAIIM